MLRGFEEKKMYILIDHRINTETDGRMYVGPDKYPHDNEALIPINSDEEKQTLDMLQKIVDNNITPKMQTRLLSIFAEKNSEGFSIDGPNMLLFKNLPIEDMKAVLLLHVIHTYKNTFHSPSRES